MSSRSGVAPCELLHTCYLLTYCVGSINKWFGLQIGRDTVYVHTVHGPTVSCSLSLEAICRKLRLENARGDLARHQYNGGVNDTAQSRRPLFMKYALEWHFASSVAPSSAP